MRRHPSSWVTTLTKLGFRRQFKKTRPSQHSTGLDRKWLEALEPRLMLASAPVLDPYGNQSVAEGALLQVAIPFSDVDVGDTHTAVIDWGDGTTQSLQILQSPQRVSGQHTYGDNGSYAVSVTLADSGN